MTTQSTPRLIPLPEVERLTGLRRTTVYLLEKSGEFPARRKVTPRASRWLEHEVVAWIESRPTAQPAA